MGMMMRSACLATLAAVTACSLLRPAPITRPQGDTPVRIANNTLQDVCNVDFLPNKKNQIDWDPLAVEGDMTAEHTHLKPGRNLEVGLQKGTYTVELESCSKTHLGRTTIDVNGPTALNIDTHENARSPGVTGYASAAVVMSPRPRSSGGVAQPDQGGQRPCLPGGDMSTGIASECCTGVILISAQRPNMPSHCAYPDEVQ